MVWIVDDIDDSMVVMICDDQIAVGKRLLFGPDGLTFVESKALYSVVFYWSDTNYF